METKHTSAPWTSYKAGDHAHPYVCGPLTSYEHGDDRPVVAYVVGMDADANARLIAAAPDLLEALQLYSAYKALPADRGGINGPKGRAKAAFDAAHATALAKATGSATPESKPSNAA